MTKPSHLAILGGGPAGLSVGYFAQKKGLPFTIYEASHRTGGNCVTFRHGDFRFDSGAHRFHDKYPEVTKEIKDLLGDDFQKCNINSQIYAGGKLFDFPLSPLNLLKKLGLPTFTKALVERLRSQLSRNETNGDFESFVLRAYGKTIAERFLLNYSEKLWGDSGQNLSSMIAGTRVRGLDLKTFFIEAFQGQAAKIKRLDGTFYYPKLGIGMIAEKLAEVCGSKNIQTGSIITKIFHDQNRIQEVQINGDQRIKIDQMVNSLPLGLFIRMMEPVVPEKILSLANSLRFRNLILVGLFLDRAMVTENASMYFPEGVFPFTRVYEPKRRSEFMAPPGKTSLIVEIPCHKEDKIWNTKDDEIIRLVLPSLSKIFSIKENEIIDSQVVRLGNAYPVLEKGFEKKVEEILLFLSMFSNMKLAGRNGKFEYSHSIHNMMKFGKEVIDAYVMN